MIRKGRYKVILQIVANNLEYLVTFFVKQVIVEAGTDISSARPDKMTVALELSHNFDVVSCSRPRAT